MKLSQLKIKNIQVRREKISSMRKLVQAFKNKIYEKAIQELFTRKIQGHFTTLCMKGI